MMISVAHTIHMTSIDNMTNGVYFIDSYALLDPILSYDVTVKVESFSSSEIALSIDTIIGAVLTAVYKTINETEEKER